MLQALCHAPGRPCAPPSRTQAAADLAASGVTVTVLEARDRLGGRVYTTKDASGKPIELGAQWIHGTNNPLP
jgi:monoamine oxidase